jgi:hypothetical protein
MPLDEGNRSVRITRCIVVLHRVVEFDTITQEDNFLRFTVPFGPLFAKLRHCIK